MAEEDGSPTWLDLQSFLNNISSLGQEDDSNFSQFVSEAFLKMMNSFLEESNETGITCRTSDDRENGHGHSGVRLRSPAGIPVASPGYDQSFFQDFDQNISVKSISEASFDSVSDFGVGMQDFSSPSPPVSDPRQEEPLGVEAVDFGGPGVYYDGPLGPVTQVVYGLPDTNTSCSNSTISQIALHGDEQRILVSCEKSSLSNSSATSPPSQVSLDIVTPYPSPATHSIKTSKNIKTIKEENCNKNGAEAKKERRRMQNRTAARRCRDRKKEVFQTMLKAMQTANAEREFYQKTAMRLKEQLHLITQELQRHRLHCGLVCNSTSGNDTQTTPAPQDQLHQLLH